MLAALINKLASLGLPVGISQVYADFADDLTATGTVQADAYESSTAVVRFTTVAAGTGVLLENGAKGDSQLVINDGANNLKVYPPVGGQIASEATNSPIVLPAGYVGWYYRISTKKWVSSTQDASTAGAAASATTATTQAGIATAQAGLAETAKTNAETAEAHAETAQAATEAARDAALAAARIYASTAAGLAAVANGEYFYVVSADDDTTLELWKDNAGVALDTGKRFPNLSAVRNAVIAVPGKNLFDSAEVTANTALNGSGTTFGSAGRNVSAYIAVSPSTNYSFTQIVQGEWYTAAFAFIGALFAGGTSGTVASPGTAAYVRLDVYDTTLATTQWEQASAPTLYESYRLDVPADRVATASIYDHALTNDKAEPFAFGPEKLSDASPLNLHDGSLTVGSEYNISDGVTITASASLDRTDWIGVKPSTQYSVNEMSRVFFYDKNRALISVGAINTFTTPANCRWVRFNLASSVSFRFQFNEGTAASATEVALQDWYRLSKLAPRKRLYNLTDAWYAWLNAEKFPIAFAGDSTVWGTGTTPISTRTFPYTYGTEETAPGAFPAKLETLLRDAADSATLRVYNAGYHGTTSDNLVTNFASIFSGAFADTKMIGIAHGINDRVANHKTMAADFEANMEYLIIKCLESGIQPFLLTAQPMLMPYDAAGVGNDNEHTETVANAVKRHLAAKWNLELIDISKFASDFQTYSSHLLNAAIYESGGSTIHWGNTGHQYEADLLFAHICPRAIWSEKGEQLDFSTQRMTSGIDYANMTQLGAIADGFKVQAKYTKGNASDILVQDFWVFNNYRGRMKLTAYAADSIGAQYVKLNGATTAMVSVSQVISTTLDMGLHHIEAWTGATTAVNWRGFKLELV